MEQKRSNKKRIDSLSRDPYKRRDEIEMLKIVQEIQSGLLGIRAACIKYGLSRNTLRLFISRQHLRTLGNEPSDQLICNMTVDQKSTALEKKVKELTKALELSRLKVESLEIIIKVAEEDLHIKIRKKHGTKQSKE